MIFLASVSNGSLQSDSVSSSHTNALHGHVCVHSYINRQAVGTLHAV